MISVAKKLSDSIYDGMDFIGLCEKWRKRIGLTQRDIVAGALDPGRYSNLKSDARRETGEDVGVTLYQAAQIAKNMGVPLDYLVDEQAGEEGQLVTDDELSIIRYVRHKGLSMTEAIDRLSMPPARANIAHGFQADPGRPEPAVREKSR